MNILMVVGEFYPVIGGAQRQCLKLAKALQARGHRVTIITVWNPRTTPQHAEVEGVSVKRVWYPQGLGFLAPVFMSIKLGKIARSFDIIHVHQALWPLFSSGIAARWLRKPVVCKIGNSGERFDLDVLRHIHLYGVFAQWYVQRATKKFVWTSRAVYDDLIQAGVSSERLEYIPNGVEISGTPSLILSDSKKTTFIFTGTFTHKKNLLFLLQAIYALPSSYQEKMQLLSLGDGPDRQALVATVKKFGLDNCVVVDGPVDDVRPYLQNSHVFVLPSSTEGLSNSALEAMVHGLPVILSNRGGNVDLVHENGILIDPTNIESLCHAITYMIDHPEERRQMGQQSRKIVEEHYAMEYVVGEYEKLYQKCV